MPSSFFPYRLVLASVFVAAIPAIAQAQNGQLDYTIGQPRIWSYDRVYPFLDGIFQDVASTQISQLTLSPNSPNASSLNASMLAVSASANFSPGTGIQNQLAQQQNSVFTANTALQSQLLTQQLSLTQQVTADNQAYGNAQTAYAAALAAAQGQITPAVSGAQAAQNAAATQLNTDTANLATVKAQLGTVTSSVASLASPSSPSAPTATLPFVSATTPPTAPAGATTPNFPVSKQMDNQINLLWERLSRLVATLSQSDNMSGYRFVLASFNIDLMPRREKNKNFEVDFCVVKGIYSPNLDSSACPNNQGADQPRVVDLFPSASAINIVDNKYHDTHWSLAALLGFPSVGVTAAFNQEHLRETQSLGQSALITGFGIGTSHFGWAIGRNLGDDQVSPGNRTVFAIIAIPKSQLSEVARRMPPSGYPEPSSPEEAIKQRQAQLVADQKQLKDADDSQQIEIKVDRAGWHKDHIDSWKQPSFSYSVHNQLFPWRPFCVEYSPYVDGACKTNKLHVTQLDYSPIEFDPVAATNNAATLQVTFDHPIDPQFIVSVDGRVIPRARDTFGRAVITGGSQGLLESTTFTTNTWIPLSSKRVALQLDPSRLERRFPEILFIGPINTVPLDQSDAVFLSGKTLQCLSKKCQAIDLPPLAFRKPSVKTPVVSDRHATRTIYVSIPSDGTTAATGSAASIATSQVLTDQGTPPWSGSTVAILNWGKDCVNLSCSASDSRLQCTIPKDVEPKDLDSWSIAVRDTDHAGGPISAWANAPNTKERPYSVWSLPAPTWHASNVRDPQAPLDTLAICLSLNVQVSIVGNNEPMIASTTSSQNILGNVSLTSSSGAPLGVFAQVGPRVDPSTTPPKPNTLAAPKFCPANTSGTPDWQGELDLDIAKFPALADQMNLSADGPSVLAFPAAVYNLHAVSTPSVSSITADDLHFVGQNLIYPQIRVGATGTPVDIQCISGTFCSVKQGTDLGKISGPVYFYDSKNNVNLAMMDTALTTPTQVQYTYTAPKDPTASGSGKGGGAGQDSGSGSTAGTGQFTLSLNISGNSGGSSSPGNVGTQVPPALGAAAAAVAPAPAATAPPLPPAVGTPPATSAAPAVPSPARPQIVVIQ